MHGFELVARVEDLGESDLLGIERSDGERICVIRYHERIFAVGDNCTHQDFPLSQGTILTVGGACVIECAWHGARFDCVSGAVKREPANEALPVLEVRIEDGGIYVGGRR